VSSGVAWLRILGRGGRLSFEATVFFTPKAIDFLSEGQRRCRVLFFRGKGAQFKPAFLIFLHSFPPQVGSLIAQCFEVLCRLPD
ncbi:MAG TPA: hypothetical protein VK513_09885, partial [Terriglobales bacterium]|nr:hypothetical protein [Terriglobales bacterium]